MMKLKFTFLSIISGILTGVSFDFPQFSFLVWFSLVPLLFVIGHNSFKKSFLYCFIAGLAYFFTTIFWVGYVSILGMVLLVIYLSLYWGFFGVLSKLFFQEKYRLISISFIWALMEYIRTVAGGFGWVLLGYSQFENLILIQGASLLGVWFISFVVVLANVFLFDIFFRKQKRNYLLKELIIVIILFGGLFCYGLFSVSDKGDADNGLSVSLIQPNTKEIEKQLPLLQKQVKEKLIDLSGQVSEGSLVIFPEASWPWIMDMGNSYRFEEFISEVGKDFIIGAVIKEKGVFYNTSVFVCEKGKKIDVYKKIRLVPFGEYVPFRDFLFFVDALNYVGDIKKGRKIKLFSYKGVKIASLICFEDIFPGFVRRSVLKGADVLLNITNDAWFKGYPEAVQHLQIAVFRALEMNRPLVRVANTGISCIISPRGEVLKVLESDNKKVFSQGILNTTFPLGGKSSVYCRIGDIFMILGLLYLTLQLWIKKRKK